MKAVIQQRLADAVGMEIPELIERESRPPKIPNKVCAVIGMRYEASSVAPEAKLLLINVSEESTMNLGNVTANIIPAWKWLLES